MWILPASDRSEGRRRAKAFISAYCGAAPARSIGGKPYLAGGPALSIAHTGRSTLVALCAGARSIGVDVEEVVELNGLDRLVEAYASPRERAFLEAERTESRARAFLRLWVRKEAVVKATGRGIVDGLAHVDALDDETIAGEARWFLRDLSVGPASVAALATDCRPTVVDVLTQADRPNKS